MPQANVQPALALMETLGGRRDVEALIALADPDVEWHSFLAVGQEGGVYRGHEGTRTHPPGPSGTAAVRMKQHGTKAGAIQAAGLSE